MTISMLQRTAALRSARTVGQVMERADFFALIFRLAAPLTINKTMPYWVLCCLMSVQRQLKMALLLGVSAELAAIHKSAWMAQAAMGPSIALINLLLARLPEAR